MSLFNLSNLKFKKLFIIVVSIQLVFLGLIGFDKIDIHIPILRKFVGFAYLTFIPGILTLRILRLHKLNNIESILYSSGISISILMFLGFLVNIICPYFGILRPISLVPLLISIYSVTIILLAVCYKFDIDYSYDRPFEFRTIFNIKVLILCFIPILSIFGTHLVNIYDNNILLLILLFVIAILPLLVAANKLSENLYPLTIFVISISLLYHSSLISQYLWGTDAHVEYYVSNLVQNIGFWDPYLYGNLYSLLSTNILTPIYSILLDMDIKWVLKVIYPFLFSMVPVALYNILQKQTNEKVAFFSSFFFMSVTPFYTVMLEVPRQQIGELFFVLFLSLLADNSVDIIKKRILSLIFVFSLLVSHYGLAYVFVLSLLLSWVILVVIKKYSAFNIPCLQGISINKEILSLNFTILILTLTTLWYLTVSKSSVFDITVNIGKDIFTTFSSGFFDKNEVESLNLIAMNPVSPLHSITKYLHLISQILISIGMFSIFFMNFDVKFKKSFFAYSIAFFCIAIFILVSPNSSTAMGIDRVYSILLLLLCQFVPLGCISFIYILLRITSKPNKNLQDISLKYLSVFLFLFLLFNSGFIYQIADDHPQSISLNSKLLHPRLVYNDGDMNGLKWLEKYVDTKKSIIYSDECEVQLVREIVYKDKTLYFSSKTYSVPLNSYIFMGPLPSKYNEIVDSHFDSNGFSREYLKFDNSTFYHNVISYSCKIFDNGITSTYK